MAWNSLGRAVSFISRLAVPQIRRSAPSSAPTPLGRVLSPTLQKHGQVVFDTDKPIEPLPFESFNPTLPESVQMLTANKVPVPPALLLEVFPWQSLLEQPPAQVAAAEMAAREIKRLYSDLVRWKSLNHLLDPNQAVDICKRFASWMSLRDIERMLQPKQSGALEAVRQILSSDLDLDKFAARHQQILELLSQNRLEEAYSRAEGALRALDSAHRLIESARLRVMEAQRRVSTVQWRAWAAAGVCLVVGLASDYFAAVPEINLPIIESVVQSAALSGSVLCLSAATALYLCSDQFTSYLVDVRDAHDAHLRVRFRLEEDLNACLDKGYIPHA